MSNHHHDIWENIVSELRRSTLDPKHPWRYYTLASVSLDGGPDARTVVNRKVTDDLSFIIFSDSRVDKIAQLQHDLRATLLFYHPKKRIQLRIYVEAEVIDHGIEWQHYKNTLSDHNSGDYNTALPPGTAMHSDANIERTANLNFAIIKLKPQRVDYLKLDREGHQRIQYTKSGELWNGESLVP